MKYFSFVLKTSILLLSVAETSLNAETPLRAGAAIVDITPRSLPALMNGGFLQKSVDRVADPLYARSLVISNSTETIAIVIVDSCMFPTSLCDRIKQLASEQTDIPVERILISATHTHSAPSAMMCLGCGPDTAYLDFIPAQVAKAIVQAKSNLRPAKIGWAIVDGSNLTHCRRWITRSDRMGTDPFGGRTVRAMMHPGYQNPNYTSPAGPIDPWLSILSVVSVNDNRPICVMANLSMHYFGGSGFSADYYGDVASVLEARFSQDKGQSDPDFVGIMSQGTSGDLHWMDYSKPQKNINRQQYAADVADRVIRACKTIEHRSDLPLAMAETRLKIQRRTPSRQRLEWARPINAARLGKPPKNQQEVYAQQAQWIQSNPSTQVVLQVVRIGELGLTAIPNEVYGITGLKLKRQSPLQGTFNLELANGATGYIPPPEQHRLGGYTTWPARTAGLAESAEPLIVETLLGLLETVSKRKRRSLKTWQSAYSEALTKQDPIAYWRLEDMDSTRVEDAVGNHHAHYKGAVALFLPGPSGAGLSFNSKPGSKEWSASESSYGNRSVYLAGGHLATQPHPVRGNYSVTFWFKNSLPADARDTTGVLLSTGSEAILIAGKNQPKHSGKLILKSGQSSFFGKTRITTQQWQHLTVTRDDQRIRIYLDGRPVPEIDTKVETPLQLTQLLIGSDGNSMTTFDGKVDEIALFARSLKATDIVNLFTLSGMTAPPQPKPTMFLGAKPQDAKSRQKYADTIHQSKPVAFWRLHDVSSQTAKDAMGKNPATYEPGTGPLQLDITKPNFSGGRVNTKIPNLGNTYSVEVWFRNELPVDSRPVTAYLFSRAVDRVEGAFGDNLGIGGTHANSGRLIVFNGNRRNQLVAGVTPIPSGSWSHVVMVRQQQAIRVYLNGDPNPEISADLPIEYPAEGHSILLGGRADNFANLQGMMEDIAIYDRALTPKEVMKNFHAGGTTEVSKPANPSIDSPAEPVPTDIEKAISTIHVPKGFEVELVAAEPLVMDPVAIDWGPDGKLWVVEMADYPLGIDDQGKPGGRVRFLEDTNKDGQFDKSTLFAEGLRFPTGVLTWGRGILLTAAPEIVYLEDSSGDGRADIHQVLYSGFLQGNQQLRVNGLRRGLDNWVYCASGSHHAGYGKDSRIYSHQTGSKHQIGSRDFRIRPNTGEIDPQSGPSQFGRTRDDWGNWFGVQNSHPLWHYVLADHNIRRNPHFAPPDPKQQVVTPTNPKVYPASQLQKRYHSFNQSGRFTSACSPMIYRDDHLFDRGAQQHAFTCEPFHNLVQHNLIVDQGVSFGFRRDPAESKIDFFASKDRWCRPVMARTGPDGALWIVDMYRYMIEHPQWLPQKGKDELRPWYRSGEDRGRIYRVVRTDRARRNVLQLADASTGDLVSALESSNGWCRDTAQQLLIKKKSSSAIKPLRDMVANSEHPLARIHAIWTLNGLDALTPPTIELALADTHPGVRRNAVRIAAISPVKAERLTRLVNDPDAKVRLELASTLGAYDTPITGQALAQLLTEPDNHLYIMAAAMSSLNARNVSTVLDSFIRSEKKIDTPITSELIGQAVAVGDKNSISGIIETVCQTRGKPGVQHRFENLAKILDGLSIRHWSLSQLSISARARVTEMTQLARVVAQNQAADPSDRAKSIQLLAREVAATKADFQIMKELLVPQSPAEIQRAVVSQFARRGDSSAGEYLLSGWTSHTPALRAQILDVIASRRSWVATLGEHLAAGVIHVYELNASVRQRILDLTENSPQWQKTLAIQSSTGRSKVLRSFQPALKMDGNPERGGVFFRKHCINCHKIAQEGFEVGPQLASITNKSKDALYASILDPSAAVDAKYFNYLVVTLDGRSHTGRLETETGSSITLLAAGGKRETILRRDIENLRSSRKSLMPDGLEQELNTQDMADLIQFVRETFR
jgi:putative membrane-bound dehydrogenase-like protein